jgi:DNA ligase 1
MILDVLKRLEREPGRNGKIAILRDADSKNVALRGVLRYALDPYKRFYVARFPAIRAPKKPSAKAQDVFALLDRLAAREVTGQAASNEIEFMRARLPVDDQVVFARILLKDLKCGVNTKTVNAAIKGLIPTFEVQRAKAYDPKRVKLWPMMIEPKLDGMRVIAFVGKDHVEYMSRGGRPVTTMGHFTEGLLELFPHGIVLDGEARANAATFQKGMSAIKRKQRKEGAQVTFTVFDALTPREFAERSCALTWKQRRKRLAPILQGMVPWLSVTPVAKARNDDEVQQWFVGMRKNGYEGVMVKDPDGLYDFKRSHVWMKVKPEDTIDVEVTGWKEGTGKYKGQLGALTFKHKRQTCAAGSGLSDNQRTKLWRQRKSLIGKLMEVKFTEETDGGRTRHARFIRFREHDGERD